jgi:predicted O-methyltransferase YrrM
MMSDESNRQINAYIGELFLRRDDILEAALQRAQETNLHPIQVPPELGRLLGILVRAVGACRVLELGTLGGYSAIHLARALPAGGRLLSLEVDPRHAAVARENLERAGLADRTEVRVGSALDLLPSLAGGEPFDFAFIDADKTSYPAYFDWCLRLVRPGGLIVADNVLRGVTAEERQNDEGARAVDAMNRAAAADPRLDAIILPVRDGRDGVLIAAVRDQTP